MSVFLKITWCPDRIQAVVYRFSYDYSCVKLLLINRIGYQDLLVITSFKARNKNGKISCKYRNKQERYVFLVIFSKIIRLHRQSGFSSHATN